MSVGVPNTTPGVFFTLSNLGLPTTQAEYLAIFQSAMAAQYPGYSPSQADPLYVQAQIGASWAANAGQLCNAGATELFRNYGTKLYGLAYQNGTPAQAIVTITAQDTAGYVLPAFSQVLLTLNGTLVGFQTATTLTITSGSSSGNVTVLANVNGSQFNGATSPAEMNSQVAWITGVTVVTTASGGVDQQDDDEYVQELAYQIQNPEPPVTAANYAAAALRFVPAANTDQEEVGRATAIDGYSTAVTSFTGTTHGTTSVTSVSSFTGITVGSVIAATDITAGQTVTVVTPGSSTLTLSAAASGSNSGESMTSTGSYGNERTVTVCVTDASGSALNSDTMTAVSTYLESLREANFIVNVVAPNYTTIYVTATVVASGNYSTATVQSNVQATLLSLLNPSNFGLPQGAITGWNNSITISLSQVTAAIQNTLGVQSVVPGTLAIGTSASPSVNTADFTIGGPFPLPLTTATSIPTSAITVNT